MATKPREGGGELFYLDEHGNQQDAALHEEILGERINKERLLPRDEHRRGRGPHALCGDQRAVLSSNGTPQRAARCSACSRSPGR